MVSSCERDEDERCADLAWHSCVVWTFGVSTRRACLSLPAPSLDISDDEIPSSHNLNASCGTASLGTQQKLNPTGKQFIQRDSTIGTRSTIARPCSSVTDCHRARSWRTKRGRPPLVPRAAASTLCATVVRPHTSGWRKSRRAEHPSATYGGEQVFHHCCCCKRTVLLSTRRVDSRPLLLAFLASPLRIDRCTATTGAICSPVSPIPVPRRAPVAPAALSAAVQAYPQIPL